MIRQMRSNPAQTIRHAVWVAGRLKQENQAFSVALYFPAETLAGSPFQDCTVGRVNTFCWLVHDVDGRPGQ
jgi:hypothetical protein